MKWFRLYNEIIDDPKVAKMKPKTFQFFIFLLCLSSNDDHNGVISLSEQEISWRLRMRVKDVKSHIDILKKLKILTSNPALSFINWSKRQFVSDSSKDRVKRYRKKKCNVTVTPEVTPPDTDTEQIQNRTDTLEQKIDAIIPAEFEQFWESYPRKKNKGQCQKTFDKLIKSKKLPSMDILLNAIKKQKSTLDWQKHNGQFIPYPSSWLNSECWEDEIKNNNSCPQQDIVNLYHTYLPICPHHDDWVKDETRTDRLAILWNKKIRSRNKKLHSGQIKYWEGLFQYLATLSYPTKEPWFSLSWLVKGDNLLGIKEGINAS